MSSITIAKIAPNNNKLSLRGGLIINSTPKDETKPAKVPERVLLPIIPNGKSFPNIAANESPIERKMKSMK